MWMWINIITNKAEGPSRQSRQSSVSPSKTGGSGSPWSKYLYSDQSSYSQSSYAESDYSLPHSPTSSRPSSQVSFYTSSCPTTPLSSRRMCQSPPGPYRTAQTVRSPSGKSGVFETLYRPDLIKLSDPRRGQRRHSEAEEVSSVRSVPVTPVSRNEIKINNRHFNTTQITSQSQSEGKNLQRSSQQKNIQRKISEECDQLLRELECDMKNMNNNLIKPSQTPQQSDPGRQVANYNKQVFYINKVKMVELNDVKFSKDLVQEKKVDIPSVNNNCSGNNQEYFDSLIKLIENAAKNLSE